MKFPQLPSGYPFPQLELEVMREWKTKQVFEKTLQKHRHQPDGKEFVFYEGPPTANNKPHVGHVVTRVIKDLFPRYRTMQGHYVERKAGWDTHGLAVEIEVEKTLGFAGKQDIEDYGVEKFNQACLESVHTYERQWREMTERIGFWIDLENAYYTYSNRYIESVWWALAKLWNEGLLVQDYKVQPYCARCGTTLSSHEVAQNYRDVDDPSVWVLFPVRSGQMVETDAGDTWQTPENLHLVAWTTTPWTLLGHAGLAVHADLRFRVVEDPTSAGRLLLFGDTLENPVPLDVQRDGKRERIDLRDQPVLRTLPGSSLASLRYQRPFATQPADRLPEHSSFEPPPSDDDGWCVFTADYVTATEGTGLVHTAPAFGEDDYKSGLRWGLPFFLTVDSEGHIVDRQGTEPFAGRWVKDADKLIIRDLKERGKLLHADRYRHNYPFCWRCDQPLLYYAAKSWFIKTTAVRDRLVALNRTIDWHPDHVREGRFGNWLENVVDWALSRERYWGTPLPIWRCSKCQEVQAIGSYEELFQALDQEPPADLYNTHNFDPHRPHIDRLTWSCPQQSCDGKMQRVEEVIDAWFDSGAMFFAQHHYPFENGDRFERQFPADFISEAVDQTRGWFYTLHALGTLLFDSVAYRTCVVLGHVNDERGVKMSKRLGNVVNPMEVIETTGADALRWYFCVNNPEASSRFSARLVREAAQKSLLPLWNAVSFFTIYANLDGWPKATQRIDETPFDQRPALDRWILLRLNRVIESVTTALESYQSSAAARTIEVFLDDLTNWYIRRSRDRFWAPVASSDEANNTDSAKESAYQTLFEVLTTSSRLIAPFMPFVTEVLYRHLVLSVDPKATESIHLESWPQPVAGRDDAELESAMSAIQRIVSLGHAARNSHGIKTRQPLPKVTLVTRDTALEPLVMHHARLLLEELNVRAVDWATSRTQYVRHEVTPIFPECGPRFGKTMPLVKAALQATDGDALAQALESHGKFTLTIDGVEEEFNGEEVEVRLQEREGTATQGDQDLLVALDTTFTDELIAEGWAREVVHRIQTARKEADLAYADRIRVRYQADTQLATAIEQHAEWIQNETLSTELSVVKETTSQFRAAPIEAHDFSFSIETVP